MFFNILSALTALVAIIVGPIISFRIAKMQRDANTISNNRQAWINELRGNISELLTLIRQMAFDRSQKNAAAIKFDDNFKWQVLFLKTTLMLNPNESDHKKLLDLISMSRKLLCDIDIPGQIEKINNIDEEILSVSQGILKREWERVKNGE